MATEASNRADDTEALEVRLDTDTLAEDRLQAINDTGEQPVVSLPDDFTGEADQLLEPPRLSLSGKFLAEVLMLMGVGIAWIASAGWVLYRSNPAPTPDLAIQWIPLLCVPVILVGVAWQLHRRVSHSETTRFRRLLTAMQKESADLEKMLELVATRLEENRGRVTEEASRLMSLGEEAADRLGRVTHFLSTESEVLGRQSTALEQAAAAARADLGALLQDLPRAEEQTRAVTQTMKEAGVEAHQQAGSFEGQLAALVARAREAEEVTGTAAQKLAAHLGHIESSASTAAERMTEASTALVSAVETGMTRADEALNVVRAGIDEQAMATLAAVDAGRARADEAFSATRAALDEQAQAALAVVETGRAHADEALRAALAGLDEQAKAALAAVDAGRARADEALSASLAGLDQQARAALAAVDAGRVRADEALSAALTGLDDQAKAALAAVDAGKGRADEALSAALAGLEEQARAAVAAVDAGRARADEALNAARAGLEQQARETLAAVDTGKARADETLNTARSALDEQATKIMTMIEQGAAALDRAGEHAARSLADRLDTTGKHLERLAEHLAVQDVAAHALVMGISNGLGDLETKFAQFTETGAAQTHTLLADLDAKFAHFTESGVAQTQTLERSVDNVRRVIQTLVNELGSGTVQTEDLVGRAQDMAQALTNVAHQLETNVPDTLQRVEEQAGRVRQVAEAIGPQVEAIREATKIVASQVGQAEAGIVTTSTHLERLGEHLAAQDAASHALVTGLTKDLADLEQRFAGLAETGLSRTEGLEESVGTVRRVLQELVTEMATGTERTGDLVGRARDMAQTLTTVAEQLDTNVPSTLQRVEEQAGRARALAETIGSPLEAIHGATTSLETASKRIEGLAEHLAAQDATSQALVTSISNDLTELEERFTRFADTGVTRTEGLEGSVEKVRGVLNQLLTEMSAGTERTGDLVGRAQDMAKVLTNVAQQLETDVPATLQRVEEQAGRVHAVAGTITPQIEAIREATNSVASQVGETEAGILSTGKHLEQLAENLTAQNAASSSLVSGIANDLTDLEERFARLAASGTERSQGLGTELENVRQVLTELLTDMTTGSNRTGDLVGRAQEMAHALSTVAQQLEAEVPASLQRVEEQAGRAQAVAEAIGPQIEALRDASYTVATQTSQAEASILRQREELERLVVSVGEGLATAEAQMRALGEATGEADTAARRITADTGPELIDALLRVRETAQQAAEKAREAISAVIPETAASLGEASRDAISDAISGSVKDQLTLLADLSERAVTTARRASDRLTRQMLTIGKTTAAIESRIEESDREREEEDAQNLSRRVTLLIESLNSTAIDVSKILSNEVSDTDWSAYLKGDRGVFTRRAVKLLSSGEARTIAQHYEDEPDFRTQVNRYVHDFEAMVRRVLAERNGMTFGATLLSSDMGKLYVALAQAIQRFR